MFSAVCPNCSSNILLGERPADGRVLCQSCGKCLRFAQAPRQIPGQKATNETIEAEFEVKQKSPFSMDDAEENVPSLYSDWESEHKNRKTLILVSLAIPVFLVAGLVVVAFAKSGKPQPKDVAAAMRTGRAPESTVINQPPSQRIVDANPTPQGSPQQNLPNLRLPKMSSDLASPERRFATDNSSRRGSRSGGEKAPPIVLDQEDDRSELRSPPKSSTPPTPSTTAKMAESSAVLRSLITELTERKNSTDKRIKTASTIGDLGAAGKEASSALCATMLDKKANLARAATEALEKVNPQIHSLAVTMLVDSSPFSRLQAIVNSGRLGSEAYPLTQIILQVRLRELANFHTDITESIIPVLASIAPNDKVVSKTIANWMVTEQRYETRSAAAKAIPKFENGKDYLPLLIQVVKTDPSAAAQLAAINSIGTFGEDAKNAEEVLRLCKTHSDGVIRQAASRTLELIGATK